MRRSSSETALAPSLFAAAGYFCFELLRSHDVVAKDVNCRTGVLVAVVPWKPGAVDRRAATDEAGRLCKPYCADYTVGDFARRSRGRCRAGLHRRHESSWNGD